MDLVDINVAAYLFLTGAGFVEGEVVDKRKKARRTLDGMGKNMAIVVLILF